MLAVRAIPGARESGLFREDGFWKLKIRAPAKEGKANKECLRFLAQLFGVVPSSVRLLSGEASGHKKFIFDTLSADFDPEAYLNDNKK